MMPSLKFQQTFQAWLDQALSEPIPESVLAFSFNLAEPWCIEVIGAEQYSEDDPDWACEEAFRPQIGILELPKAEVGNKWEAVLDVAVELVRAYLERPSTGSERLQRAIAIEVGFVDGDPVRVWPLSKG